MGPVHNWAVLATHLRSAALLHTLPPSAFGGGFYAEVTSAAVVTDTIVSLQSMRLNGNSASASPSVLFADHIFLLEACRGVARA